MLLKYSFVVIFAYLASVSANTLVVLDSDKYVETHENFLSQLTEIDPNTNVIPVSQFSNLDLVVNDKPVCDRLVILAGPSDESEALLNPVRQFVFLGGNVFLAGSQDASFTYRKLVQLLGLSFLPKDGHIVDSRSEPLGMLKFDDLNIKHPIFNDYKKNGPIFFKGTGMKFHSENILISPILKLKETYSFINSRTDVKTKLSTLSYDTLLLAGVQMTNGKRAVISSSLELLSNEFFDMVDTDSSLKSINQNIVNDLLNWCFQMRAMIKVVESNLTSTTPIIERNIVNKNDIVTYKFKLEVSNIDGSFIPFVSNKIKVFLKKMHEKFALEIKEIQDDGTYIVEFGTKDCVGFYKIIIEHDIPGFSRMMSFERLIVYENQFFGYIDYHSKYLPFYISTTVMFIMTVLLVFKLSSSKIKIE